MSRSVHLRPWQKAALELFAASPGQDFLAVATPGAGKTTFALTAVVQDLSRAGRRVIIVAPTAHLKHQWARAATRFGLHLDWRWSPAEGRFPGDMHGIVTTYQQVAGSAAAFSRMAVGAFVVFDEIHHAGDDRAWGEAIRLAFEPAGRRLALSGTPFRSDTRAIPFVRYELDEARPDFEYGYGEALADGRVVRPVYFPRTGGHMEWSAPDGSLHAATFDDELDTARANQRLRTALSLDGEWLPEVLRSAHERLMDIRRVQADAGGLVIATDQDHARGIADQLEWRFGVRAAVATSDDPLASERIAGFAASAEPWLVAVRMVSEGVDIPRLRVGVYAATTTTELFFRQAVGRFVRWVPGVRAQRSYVFIPDDPRLRARAAQIAEQRRHSLRRERSEAEPTPDEALDDRKAAELAAEGQLSLFAAISAVATDAVLPAEVELAVAHATPDVQEAIDPALVVELAPLPPLRGGSAAAGDDGALSHPDGGSVPITRRELKQRLRQANAVAARDLVHRTGWSHARVNAELNRLSGLRKVTEATVEQLQGRLTHAERWLRRL